MGDYQYNFAQPWNNSFYYHYLQQHTVLSYHFQKMHSNIPYGIPYDIHNIENVSNHADYSSSCSSCCSCCSGNCSKSSLSQYEEEQVMDCEEMYEEQYQDEDYNEEENESECEYEFNVDVILAMRAAKEELKKQEMLDSKDEEESSDSKESESSESKERESSKDEQGSKSDSIVLVDSDKEEFEFIDLSNIRSLDCKMFKGPERFNRTEEAQNWKGLMEGFFGEHSSKIISMETGLISNFDTLYDDEQPGLWPVLPLLL